MSTLNNENNRLRRTLPPQSEPGHARPNDPRIAPEWRAVTAWRLMRSTA